MKRKLCLVLFLFLFSLVVDITTAAGAGVLESCNKITSPSCGQNWDYSMGYKFTPNTNGQITNLCGYFSGTKTVKLYNSSYTVLASASVTSSNSWSCTSITPIGVTSGSAYYVVAEIGGSGGCMQAPISFPTTCGNFVISANVYQTPSGTFNAGHFEDTSSFYGIADVVFSPTTSVLGSCSLITSPSCDIAWDYSMGYKFTPNTNGQITNLCGYFSGTKTVKLYDSSYTVLASASVTSSNSWSCTSITPIGVTSGSAYYVVAEMGGSGACTQSVSFPATCGNFVINAAVYQTPSGTFNAGHGEDPAFMYGIADVVFSAAADTTPPTVGQTTPTSATVNAATTFSASVSDNVAVTSCNLYVDGVSQGAMTLGASPCTSCTASKSYTFTTTGTHTMFANCSDAAGNSTNGTSVNVNVTAAADTTPPTVGQTTPTSATVNAATTFSASVSDNVAVTSCNLYVDGVSQGAMTLGASPCTSCTASRAHTFTTTGTHTMYARCSDAAGNSTNGTSVNVNVTVDITLPSGTLTAPSSASPSQNFNITLSATDDTGVKRLDLYYGGSWHLYNCPGTSPCSHDWTTQESTAGTYRYYGNIWDNSGNASSWVCNGVASGSCDSDCQGAGYFRGYNYSGSTFCGTNKCLCYRKNPLPVEVVIQ